MKIDITDPWAFCALALLAYPAGILVGYALDKTIKAIWPPRQTVNTRRFHIRRA